MIVYSCKTEATSWAGSLQEHSDQHFRFGNNSFQFQRFTEISFTTDLAPLYKKDKTGRWLTLTFSLVFKEVGPCLRRQIECTGMKTREWVVPVKAVASKKLSRVIDERLQSAWNKKAQRDGWLTEKNMVVLGEPMLLHHYDLYWEKLKLPCIQFPKLNGIRATWKPGYPLMSRKRNHFEIPHLEAELATLGMTVDGELWHPHLTLEEIVSLVKGKPCAAQEGLEFHIFDRPQGSNSYPQRMKILIENMAQLNGIPHLKVIPMQVVNSHDDIEANHHAIMKTMSGIDGTVLRNILSPYEFNSRSYDVLKKKDIISREFKVNAILFDEDAEHGKMIKFSFSCLTQSFMAVPNWTKKKRAEFYVLAMAHSDSVLGASYTVEFREWTAKGLPRHVVSVTARDYE